MGNSQTRIVFVYMGRRTPSTRGREIKRWVYSCCQVVPTWCCPLLRGWWGARRDADSKATSQLRRAGIRQRSERPAEIGESGA